MVEKVGGYVIMGRQRMEEHVQANRLVQDGDHWVLSTDSGERRTMELVDETEDSVRFRVVEQVRPDGNQ